MSDSIIDRRKKSSLIISGKVTRSRFSLCESYPHDEGYHAKLLLEVNGKEYKTYGRPISIPRVDVGEMVRIYTYRPTKEVGVSPKDCIDYLDILDKDENILCEIIF